MQRQPGANLDVTWDVTLGTSTVLLSDGRAVAPSPSDTSSTLKFEFEGDVCVSVLTRQPCRASLDVPALARST